MCIRRGYLTTQNTHFGLMSDKMQGRHRSRIRKNVRFIVNSFSKSARFHTWRALTFPPARAA